jgi:hypothetical protein
MTDEERLEELLDRRRWHLGQAAEAEAEKHWFAAVFHLDRLLAGDPDNADLRRRRDCACAERTKPPSPRDGGGNKKP